MEIKRGDKINDSVNVEVTVEDSDTNSTSYICLIKGYVFETLAITTLNTNKAITTLL